tara:strand:+ start:805 stop:1251 length:447 start_codon:yes stop_codon:yes gene_type:complete
MKINTPDFAHNIDHNGIKLFLAFMHRVASKRKEKEFEGHRYYIHASDVKYFVQNDVKTPGVYFGGYEKYFTFGKASDAMWMFEWKQQPTASQLEYDEPHLTAVWGYIIARDMFSDLSEDIDNGKIPEEQTRRINNIPDRQFFRYFGMK